MSVRAMLWAFDHAPPYLTPTQRHVLVALADHVDDSTSEAWPSIGRLARRTGRGESTVRRALKAIEDAGIITIDLQAAPSRGTDWTRPNLYLWHPDGIMDGTADRDIPPVDKPPVTVTPGVTLTGDPLWDDTHPPVPMTPEPSLEPSENTGVPVEGPSTARAVDTADLRRQLRDAVRATELRERKPPTA